MCGIAGFVHFDGHQADEAGERLVRMANALRHRGPDAEGYFVDRFAALGHRRLSIIDLSAGQQPMGAVDGSVQIVFNGEIYNFNDVRSDLERRGYRFRTRSDTEVILVGYLEWGEKVVERLNGMFAFAVWDARSRKLFLARDRVGKKPLYYFYDGKTFAFASELKALRAAGFVQSRFDPRSLDCYLCMGYIPAPLTIYSSVHKLKAAHSMTVTPEGAAERRYWTLSFAEPVQQSFEEVLEEFSALFDDAVERRLMSEVPLGAFLSGGLDSSLVVSSMARKTTKPVITHTVGFDDPDGDETEAAREIASFLETDHREFRVQPNAAEVLEKIAWHLDEPLADSSALPTWYVCELTRRSVTVALSGDGGDEGFGGYTFRYVPHSLESRIRSVLPPGLRTMVFGPLGSLWPASARLPRPLRLKTVLENLATSDAEAFYRDLIWLRQDARKALYAQPFVEALKGFTPFEVVHSYYAKSDAPDALGRSQYTDINVYMTDDVLAKVDRMSMAHSLEVRAPLLDYRILEFAARLPSDYKLRSGKGKVLLRALAEKRLPPSVRARSKRGFSIPAARWLREDLKAQAEAVLFESRGLCAEVLERHELKQLWREHQSGARDHSVFIWGLMMLGLWEQSVAKHETRCAGPLPSRV